MLITKALLVENKACEDQIKLFEKFLDGAESIEATPENVQRAYAFGLNVAWTFEPLGLNFSGMLERNGYQEWYLNGKYHRADGPAVTYSDGYQAWWLNGERHREDGPAVIYSNGYQAWYLNDKRHRTDGPAVINSDGTKRYYLNGKLLTEEEHRLRTQPAETQGCNGKIVEIEGIQYQLTEIK